MKKVTTQKLGLASKRPSPTSATASRKHAKTTFARIVSNLGRINIMPIQQGIIDAFLSMFSGDASTPPPMDLFQSFNRTFIIKICTRRGVGALNARNGEGVTPLICAVQRHSLSCAMLLLAHGADTNSCDKSGNSPLTYVLENQRSQTKILKLLVCFGGQISVSQKKDKKAYEKMLAKFVEEINSKEHKWEKPEETKVPKLKAICSDCVQHEALEHQRNEKKTKDKRHGIRALSLDGGGIRGLVLIQMLLEIEKRLYPDGLPENAPNFVQKHFNLVGGTSTGAIVALALADGSSLLNCLRLYFRLKDAVFCGPKMLLGCYAPENLEEFLKEQFGSNKRMSNLWCGEKMKLFVTATKIKQLPTELVRFRTYRSRFSDDSTDPQKIRVWKAARYTSAAPTYFPSLDNYIDGGIMANNPSVELLLELASMDNSKLQFLLSLGTGVAPTVELATTESTFATATIEGLVNNYRILMSQIANSDGPLVDMARLVCHAWKAPFFRLTPKLSKFVALDTTDDWILVDMLWEARNYMHQTHSKKEVDALIKLLRTNNE